VLAWAVVDAAMLTGLRVSEIARLTVGDFDPKRSALRVWRHKRKAPAQETMAIPVELAKHLGEFIEWKGLVEQDTSPKAPLFAGKRGPLTVWGLMRIWKRAVEKAGLPKELSIHSARHTVAVHLLKKTGNLRQVQKQLGHASPATTANMYADVTFEDMREGMNDLYDGASAPS
jgi:integrase